MKLLGIHIGGLQSPMGITVINVTNGKGHEINITQQEGIQLHGSDEQGPTSNQKQEVREARWQPKLQMPAGNTCTINATADGRWHRYHAH